MTDQALPPKPDPKALIDLIVEQHQNGAADGVIRLTARCIMSETEREQRLGLLPVFQAAQALRACFATDNHSIYLMKAGVELERAALAFDEATVRYGATIGAL